MSNCSDERASWLDLGAIPGVAELVEPGQVAVQVCVDVRGQVASGVLGTDMWGSPCTRTTLHNVFCASKPMLFMVLLAVLEQRRVPQDASVTELVEASDRSWVPDVKLFDLLSHQAGLVEPTILSWRLSRPSERRQLLRTASLGPAGSGYSEVRAGLIAEAILRFQCGWTDLPGIFQERILPSWGLSDSYFSLDESRCVELSDRISASVFMSGERRIPFLGEMEPGNLMQVSPALGCYTTADDLCRFYRLVLECTQNGDVAFMPEAIKFDSERSRPPVSEVDPRLGRPAAFSKGFMVDIADRLDLRQVSASTFGHTGGFCTSVGFADPVSDVAASIVVGRYIPDQALYDSVVSQLVRSVLEEVL